MKHINRSQRDQLQALFRANHTQDEIADIIGCSQSAVSRELKRNSSYLQQRYKASTAQVKSEERKKRAKEAYPLWHANEELLSHVLTELEDGKTPEQIAGRKKFKGLSCVSHQTIYTYIRNDRWNGGKLYKRLRYQGKKYKWIGFKKDKTKIPNRKDISERPKAVAEKKRAGDWESDLVVSGKDGKGAIATFGERFSIYLQAIKVESKSADEMVRASEAVFEDLPEAMKRTMTHDNGREITKHEEITEKLGIDVYCARPYKSCDRGLNEWLNRELRRFFPKGTDFSKILQKEIDSAVNWLNNCPRKSLNYRTPKEVFEEQLEIMHFKV